MDNEEILRHFRIEQDLAIAPKPKTFKVEERMSIQRLRDLMKPHGCDLTDDQLAALRTRLYRMADGITDVILASPTDSTITDEHGVSHPAKSQLLEMGMAVEYEADDDEAEQ